MKIYLYLDESGSIHKNSPAKYFAIGGYMVYGEKWTKDRIINKYKKINKNQKLNRKMPLTNELKTRDMEEWEKIQLITKIQVIDGFFGCAIVFDKPKMYRDIEKANIFFNYGVKILFKDCILPILPEDDEYEFNISIDNRNVKVGDLKDLEKFLNTEFCYFGHSFKTDYFDSATNYGIQLADLIVNSMYMRFKDRNCVSNLMECIDANKFRLNLFPGRTHFGRITKVDFEKSVEGNLT